MIEQFLSCYGSCSKAVQTMTETFAPKVMSQLQSSKTELLHQLSVYAPPFYSFIFFSFFLIFLLFRSNDELVHFLEEQQGAQKYLNSYLVEISSADQRRSSMISDFTFAFLFTIFFQLKLYSHSFPLIQIVLRLPVEIIVFCAYYLRAFGRTKSTSWFVFLFFGFSFTR